MADELVAEEWEIGRVEDPEKKWGDLEPIPIKIYGYEEKPPFTEHEFVFHVRPTEPLGAAMDLWGDTDEQGKTKIGPGVKYIEAAVIEEDRQAFHEAVHSNELRFDAEALAQLAEKLIRYYAGIGPERPTKPRSARRSTQRHTGRTSTAGRSGKASASTRSTRRTA